MRRLFIADVVLAGCICLFLANRPAQYELLPDHADGKHVTELSALYEFAAERTGMKKRQDPVRILPPFVTHHDYLRTASFRLWAPV
jgi:hypothetical protein